MLRVAQIKYAGNPRKFPEFSDKQHASQDCIIQRRTPQDFGRVKEERGEKFKRFER